jgi:hypothetical protein
MNAAITVILSVLSVGGIVAAIEVWIRSRERKAADAERHRIHTDVDRIRVERESRIAKAALAADETATVKHTTIAQDHEARLTEVESDPVKALRALEKRTEEKWR